MREIKFRAWDKEDELMYDVIRIHFNTRGYVAVPVIGPDGWELERRKLSRVELMQHTGIKDKNGKEIWEGDIIEYLDKGSLTHDFIEPVIWIDNKYNVGWGTDNSENVWAEVARLSVVIGNIYENPELLQS